MIDGLPMNPRRVLIVDDNPDAVAVLSIALRRGGHQVQRAADGRSAIEIARKLRPELVFLDLGLPQLTGFDVARALRRELGSEVRIIAVTGSGQQEDREAALEAGFDHYLLKPVDLGFVESLLGQRH